MQFILASIKDRAVEAFQPISCCRSEGEAVRAFKDAIDNPQNRTLHSHPDDYDLYVVGYMDDATGLLERLDQPKKIADGKAISQQGE